MNTLSKIKPKIEHKEFCPVCLGHRDKIINVLEKGSVIGDDFQKDKKLTIGNDFEVKQLYINSNYYQSKNDFEKICCFACARIFENSKNNKDIDLLFPSVIQDTSRIIAANLNKNSVDNDKKLVDFTFY